MTRMRTLWFFSLLVLPLLVGAQAGLSNDFEVEEDVLWASPEGFSLTMDIYTPKTGRETYPVLVIFHGGGWLINNKSIMDDMSRYVVEHGEYVVCNVDYRLLGDMGNTVTMDEIVEDAFGAVLWIEENVSKYKGDPARVAVTGDSAGGHLAAMVVAMGHRLSESGFDQGPKGFRPSYLPAGVTIAQLLEKGGIQVEAGLISYGAFDLHAACSGDFEKPSNFFWQMAGVSARPIFGDSLSVALNPDYYQAVSPLYNVPLASERPLPPQLFTVGTLDNVTTPESVKAYMDKVEASGHSVTYWEHEGRPHAFVDSGSNAYLGISFEKDGIPAMEVMLEFLDGIFYP